MCIVGIHSVMLSRRSLSLCGLSQCRGFLSRHVYEPKLLVGTPKGKPVVLLIGWAGAKYSHLEKYSNLYTAQGYRTVSFIAPCYHYRIPNARNGFYISPVFLGIDAKSGNFQDFKNSPIICHVFSMNGVRSLISLWKWTEVEQKTYLRERIKGIIFDSTPAPTQAGPDSHAVVESTPPVEGLHWVDLETRKKFLKTLFNMRKAVAHSISALYPPIRSQLSMYYYMQEYMKLPTSQLYIYSITDEFIREKYIKRFLEYQKELGREVEELVFDDSPHVMHYKSHPEQYRSACINFVNRLEKQL